MFLFVTTKKLLRLCPPCTCRDMPVYKKGQSARAMYILHSQGIPKIPPSQVGKLQVSPHVQGYSCPATAKWYTSSTHMVDFLVSAGVFLRPTKCVPICADYPACAGVFRPGRLPSPPRYRLPCTCRGVPLQSRLLGGQPIVLLVLAGITLEGFAPRESLTSSPFNDIPMRPILRPPQALSMGVP